MQLCYVSREEYRSKTQPEVIARLRDRFGSFYLVPEGGTNALALKGCKEIVDEIDIDFDIICCACGTGGTLAGIITGLRDGQKAIGFAVLKGAGFLKGDIATLLGHPARREQWCINLDFHFGGFAKVRPELLAFIDEFYDHHAILLDPIYTGSHPAVDTDRALCVRSEAAVPAFRPPGTSSRSSWKQDVPAVVRRMHALRKSASARRSLQAP